MTALVPSRTGDLAFFKVTGMNCPACAATATQLVAAQPGVLSCEISFASEMGRLRFDPARTDARTALKSLKSLNFSGSLTGGKDAGAHQGLAGNITLQLITSIAFGMQVMGLSLVHLYPAYQSGNFDAPDVRSVQVLAWLLATPVLFYGGLSFLIGAVGAARARTATMDTLVSLGVLSAYGYSVWFTVFGGGPVYFDSVVMICVFILTGRYIERLGADRARKEVRTLLTLQPETAMVRDGDGWRESQADELRAGDVVMVRAGERVPADGCVLEGCSAVNEALLTGEAVPVVKSTGATAYAGTVATDGTLICEVRKSGTDTRLGRIAALVEHTLRTKPPIQRLADRVSAHFALFVALAAVLTLTGWLATGHALSEAVLAAVAVVVVACPCALGLATPLAISAATGRASMEGVFMREPSALETGAGVTRVVFDKTGTLTTGRMSVDVEAAPGWNPTDLLTLAASLEQASTHPLATALVETCRGVLLHTATDVQNVPGGGICGTVGTRRVALGTLDHLRLEPDHGLRSVASKREASGETLVWIALDDTIAGFFAFRDSPNASARDAITRLRGMGIRTALLSGDSDQTTRAIGALVGVPEAEGRQTPEIKSSRVGGWQASGETVAMIGDGVNDAPALARADLAIAIGSGADIAGETSDVILTRDDLRAIPWFINLCQRTRRIIRQNLFWAFTYNLLMLPLAATGVLSPMIAAAAMACSSLIVVGNSLRLGIGGAGRREQAPTSGLSVPANA
jgi:heavy metal translocating P-type ATPase